MRKLLLFFILFLSLSSVCFATEPNLVAWYDCNDNADTNVARAVDDYQEFCDNHPDRPVVCHNLNRNLCAECKEQLK